jgi:endonuclease/exonuclease/phosphatase family metal-dependent hydrolase
MKSIVFKIFILLNVVLAIALGMSYLARYVAPSLSLPIAFAGMAYSYILVVFLLFTLILVLRKKYMWILFNLLVVGVGWQNLSSWLQFNFKNKAEYEFRVMSYNVKLFDLYNWKNNRAQKTKMLEFIAGQQPDIVSFQEFYYDNKKFPIDSVSKALSMPYFYVTDSRFLNNFQHFGQAIFSKYPIKESDLIKFPNTTNMALYCDIEIDKNKTIRVFSNHMESYRFSQVDYQFIGELKDKKTDIDKIPGLLERLEYALVKRSYQAEKMASLIKSSPYPVIVTGDFNDTPNSYTYHQMKGDLKDAFEASGRGFSNTYKGDFPSFRIDFILYGEGLNTSNYERLSFDISDHYPIIADFSFEKQ